MEYDLSRIDYTLCGITYPETLKVLQSVNEKVQQKFVVGDKNGVLQCLGIKDEEPVVQFKTLPSKSITSVIVHSSSSGTNDDKIYVASGNEVKGYTRKGKVFLTVETLVSEVITSMWIIGNDLILCSGRTVTYCKDLNQLTSFMCEDRVLDVAAFMTANSTRIRLLLLIANKGAAIVENGKFITRVYMNSGPSRLAVPQSQRPTEICAFYGAADGSIGLILYHDSNLISKCLVDGQGLGSVVCVGWFRNYRGTHLVVGRHDGSIQLYLTNLENYEEKLQLKYTYFCGEPITSVCGGFIGSDEPEILASTFSGRIFGLRPRSLQSAAVVNVPADALASRRAKLENEITRLEKQTANERDKYQKSTRSLQTGLSMPPLLDIQHELTGANKNGWIEARITSAMPLDMLFIYCNNKLVIQTDTAAVLSLCPPQDQESDLLATIRCQAGTRRLWLGLRNIETILLESTKVLVYVLPAGAPRVARLIKFNLAILPYYCKHEEIDVNESERCLCELRVLGTFSVVEVTSWLNEALPGELPKPASYVNFVRSHTLMGTYLFCQYQRGSAIFKSDNISTIADLKDIISNLTIKKGLKVDITYDIPDNCCALAFENLTNEFQIQYKWKNESKLKNCLSALDLDTNLINSEGKLQLCTDYLRVWELPENLNETCFDQLTSEIEKWYTNWKKLSHGQPDSQILAELHESLENGRIEEVKNILTLH
ncbi:unnamed protein product [Pieris brassicae]|uniref:Bardet-Biedl syndrome 7 protein homolog n=1 Tax=Pieris brassicae TaxID=7116 RepID=A0A9P0XFZ2_PIEBR|nr:unnamed protein product [Pieris brassicae]